MPDFRGGFFLLVQVMIHGRLVIQVVRNDRVNVGQFQSRVMTGNFLGRVSLIERTNNDIQCNPCTANANDAILIKLQRGRLCFNYQCHHFTSVK